MFMLGIMTTDSDLVTVHMPQGCLLIQLTVRHSEVQMKGVTFGLHSYTDTSDCTISFSYFPPPKPMYNTILHLVYVRYNLASRLCTIRSSGFVVYDINLRATTTTILSTRGVQIPIDLVSSATDSFRRCVVLFKPVLMSTSDPKSEFLCQSSYLAQNLQTP